MLHCVGSYYIGQVGKRFKVRIVLGDDSIQLDFIHLTQYLGLWVKN